MITQKKDKRYRQFKKQESSSYLTKETDWIISSNKKTSTKRQSRTKRYPARNAIRPDLQRHVPK